MSEKKEYTKEQAQIQAGTMTQIFMWIPMLDIDMLKQALSGLKSDLQRLELLGGLKYGASEHILRMKQMEAKIKRMDTLIKFVQVFTETNGLFEVQAEQEFLPGI